MKETASTNSIIITQDFFKRSRNQSRKVRSGWRLEKGNTEDLSATNTFFPSSSSLLVQGRTKRSTILILKLLFKQKQFLDFKIYTCLQISRGLSASSERVSSVREEQKVNLGAHKPSVSDAQITYLKLVSEPKILRCIG